MDDKPKNKLKINYHIGFIDEKGNPSKPTKMQKQAWDQLMEAGVVVQLAIGGTRGTKTSYGVWAMLQLAMKHPGIGILLGHCNIQDLESSVLFHLERMCPETYTPEPTEEDDDPKPRKVWERIFRKKAIIVRHPDPKYNHPKFGYMCCFYPRPLDITKGLTRKWGKSGIQIGAALIDQVDLLGPSTLDETIKRLSGEGKKIVMTANPPDDDIPAWYEDTFISDKRFDTKGWESRRYIVMNPTDNPHISKDYVKNIEDNLPEDAAARSVHGVRRTGQGMIYDNFTDEHFIDFSGEIPAESTVLEVVDWGVKDPALCQWWVRLPNGKWMRQGSIQRQGLEPIPFAKLCLDYRRKLLMGNRKPGQKLPGFLGTVADPGMFEIGRDGSKSVARQMASYVAEDDMRFNPQAISRKYGKLGGLVNSQISRTRDMINRGLILINRLGDNYQSFVDQIHQYKWKENKTDAEPNELRVRGGFERKTIHHFEEAICFRYFGWHVNPDASLESTAEQEVMSHAKSWSRSSVKQQRQRPFQRFERAMRNM